MCTHQRLACPEKKLKTLIFQELKSNFKDMLLLKYPVNYIWIEQHVRKHKLQHGCKILSWCRAY